MVSIEVVSNLGTVELNTHFQHIIYMYINRCSKMKVIKTVLTKEKQLVFVLMSLRDICMQTFSDHVVFSCITLRIERRTVLVCMHECTHITYNSIVNFLHVVVCLYLYVSSTYFIRRKFQIWNAHTETMFTPSIIAENTFREAVLFNQKKTKSKHLQYKQCVCKLPIGNPPVTTAGLLNPTLLAAETLNTSCSQFCITPLCGVL